MFYWRRTGDLISSDAASPRKRSSVKMEVSLLNLFMNKLPVGKRTMLLVGCAYHGTEAPVHDGSYINRYRNYSDFHLNVNSCMVDPCFAGMTTFLVWRFCQSLNGNRCRYVYWVIAKKGGARSYKEERQKRKIFGMTDTPKAYRNGPLEAHWTLALEKFGMPIYSFDSEQITDLYRIQELVQKCAERRGSSKCMSTINYDAIGWDVRCFPYWLRTLVDI